NRVPFVQEEPRRRPADPGPRAGDDGDLPGPAHGSASGFPSVGLGASDEAGAATGGALAGAGREGEGTARAVNGATQARERPRGERSRWRAEIFKAASFG